MTGVVNGPDGADWFSVLREPPPDRDVEIRLKQTGGACADATWLNLREELLDTTTAFDGAVYGKKPGGSHERLLVRVDSDPKPRCELSVTEIGAD